MQIEKKTDELNPCLCGYKPDFINIGYGRTPYSVFCPDCKKSTNFTKFEVTGGIGNIIDYWNKHVSCKTKEELEIEYQKFLKKQKKNTGYDMYKVWQWYWSKDGKYLNKYY